MAFTGRNVTLSTTRAVIVAGADPGSASPEDTKAATVKNTHATITIYLGGSDVDATHGLPLLAGEAIAIGVINKDDDLYAVAASGTPVVAILEVN